MIDCVDRLVVKLGNSFTNLDEKEKEYNVKNDKLHDYQKLLDFINFDAKKLNKYENQDIIKEALDAINSTIERYNAACYLLDSDDENVALLPQYRNSKNYLETLINYLKLTKDQLENSVLNLEKECAMMHLYKKYFELLKEDKPLVKDIDEFMELLDGNSLSMEDRNGILSYIIKCNVDNYKKKN